MPPVQRLTAAVVHALDLLLAAAVLGMPPAPAAAACHEESRVAMGCTATVRACGPDADALPAIVGEALDEIDRVDRLMSHYRRDSPLSRLNREAANGPVAVEPELLDFLAECLRWSRESDGAFDVTVGPLMKAWGFFRDEGRVPGEDELARALDVVGYRHVVLDREPGRSASTAPASSWTSAASARATPWTVSSSCCGGGASPRPSSTSGGSSVYGLGAPPGAERLGDRHPGSDRPGKTARTVRLRDRALSVSGGYERFFEKDGVTYSHIMDPRTGRPVQGVLSVAVLSDSATDGDALDNVLFVQGVERAAPFLRALPLDRGLLLPAEAGRRVEARPRRAADRDGSGRVREPVDPVRPRRERGSRRSATPSSSAPCRRYGLVEDAGRRRTPVTSVHWRSDTSPPRRNHSSFARTVSSAEETGSSLPPSAVAGRARSSARRSKGRSLDTNTSTFTMVSRWMTLNDARRAMASRTRSSET